LEPGKKNLVTAMSIQMRIYLATYGEGQLRGELHSRYLSEPYVFADMINMIHKMEDLFDTNGFPQAFLSTRSFDDGKRGKMKRKVERNGAISKDDQTTPISAKCSFDVTVRFRQNATWQGQIFWVERNVRQDFRSVLEMLKLMDEAMTDGDDSEGSVDWSDTDSK